MAIGADVTSAAVSEDLSLFVFRGSERVPLLLACIPCAEDISPVLGLRCGGGSLLCSCVVHDEEGLSIVLVSRSERVTLFSLERGPERVSLDSCNACAAERVALVCCAFARVSRILYCVRGEGLSLCVGVGLTLCVSERVSLCVGVGLTLSLCRSGSHSLIVREGLSLSLFPWFGTGRLPHRLRGGLIESVLAS